MIQLAHRGSAPRQGCATSAIIQPVQTEASHNPKELFRRCNGGEIENTRLFSKLTAADIVVNGPARLCIPGEE